jgi:hypothetical protein
LREGELKEKKDEAVAAKKEEHTKRSKQTTKDLVAMWWKDGAWGCSKDPPRKM